MTKNNKCLSRVDVLPNLIYSLIDILAYQAARDDFHCHHAESDINFDVMNFRHKDII